MNRQFRYMTAMMALAIAALVALLPATFGWAAPAAEPVAAPAATTVELLATGDARTRSTSPTANQGSSFLFFLTEGSDYNFIQFDLSVLPADATIDAAELLLNFTTVSGGSRDIEIGRADGAWDEATITWDSQPNVTWSGLTRTVDAVGEVRSNVTPLVQSWQSGAQPNHGLVLRGTSGDANPVIASSKETGVAPTLVVTYSVPDDTKPRPDVGDAPDSTNSLGIALPAYPGVPANFPTVWGSTPAGQPAGPRHANQSYEAWLGDYLSRENEADSGPDQDPKNNILDGGTANANNDRGDDGWRNPTASFTPCEPTTVVVRVSKAAVAQKKRLFLNVWFDGNRDGDWDDEAPCDLVDEGYRVPGYEWIVQDFSIDMNAILAGGFTDFAITTERVLNTASDKVHWMRFTLSEERAVKPQSGLADGRGPHPASALGNFQFGETEDVLYRPQGPGEDGILILEKRIISPTLPVEYADTVTYQIRLRHEGGSQPIEAEIRDELPYPLHLLRQISSSGQVEMVIVDSATGGASPLRATVGYKERNQVVTWQGALAPNSEIRLDFDVHVHPLCGANEQTQEIRNVAQARPRGAGAAEITDETMFSAACPGYSAANLVVQQQVIEDLPAAATSDKLGNFEIQDFRAVPIRTLVTNNHSEPLSLEIEQTATYLGRLQPAANQPRLRQRLTVEAGETQSVDLILRMDVEFTDELKLPDDFMVISAVNFCLLNDNEEQCPDAQSYPHLVGEAEPLTITVRPFDLGDAPDSSNHATTAMAAYAGVQAKYPTVLDAATGLPEGPAHAHPRPFHLGQLVSREVEADSGADEDPSNNILPAANVADRDRADDGANPSNWPLAHCQQVTFPVQVFISPQAANWFAEKNEDAYLNIWVDSNRDGDWDDGGECQPSEGQKVDAVEHIVIDHPVDVVALGPGLHTVFVPTNHVPWPATLAQQPAWVRVSLSERESNKTLQSGAIKHGDGRGYDQPFHTGETEDYLLTPQGADGAGPDVEVNLVGAVRRGYQRGQGLQAAAPHMTPSLPTYLYRIRYGNRGSATARGALLEFQIPEKLRDGEIVLLQAPGIAQEDITRSIEKIQFGLPDLRLGDGGGIILGWYGCLTCTLAAADVTAGFDGNVSVTLEGDVDPSNNQSTTEVSDSIPNPVIGLSLEAGNDIILGGRAITCKSQPPLRGFGEPNRDVQVYVDGQLDGTAKTDIQGAFAYTPTLSSGRHRIQARYPEQANAAGMDFDRGYLTPYLQLVINLSLGWEPSSLRFIDDGGRMHLPAVRGFFDVFTELSVDGGENYTAVVEACTDDANSTMQILVNNENITEWRLNDQGQYTGNFTVEIEGANAAQSAASLPLTFLVSDGASQMAYQGQVNSASSGKVTDAVTGQPVAGASVSALVGSSSGGESYFELWDGSALGQSNPLQAATDGTFDFSTEAGVYRLAVEADGYQSYRSGDIDVAGNRLVADVELSPAVTETTTHIVTVDESGFSPAALTVRPGAVIEWVNTGLADHSVESSAWDSGVLPPGASYKVKVSSEETFAYEDGGNRSNQGSILVDADAPSGTALLFLPAVTR